MPKVSVIIPVYNVEKYLTSNLESLTKQTLKDIELIYIDDFSTDSSLSVIEKYAEKDNRIKIIKLEKNSGAAVARNKGLDIAIGEYLGFVDPDDTVDLNFYEELYKKAKEDNDADIVKCDVKWISLDGQIIYGTINQQIKEKGKYYFIQEWQTAIYKHSMIKNNNIRFPDECRKAQDIVFLNRAIMCTHTLSLIDNVYYNYYRREDSLDADKISLSSIKSALIAYKLILNNYNSSDLYTKNKSLYMDLYLLMYNHMVFYLPFKNDDFIAKQECAKAMIDYFYMCKDANKLKENFDFKNLLVFIRNKDIEGLAKVLYKNTTLKNLANYGESLKDKLLSIKDSIDKKHKVITILGIKIKLKRKQR